VLHTSAISSSLVSSFKSYTVYRHLKSFICSGLFKLLEYLIIWNHNTILNSVVLWIVFLHVN
jgi:hypothetical protein